MTVLDHATLVAQDQHQLHGLHHPSSHKDPLIVARADGVWLYGDDGRKVLDAMAHGLPVVGFTMLVGKPAHNRRKDWLEIRYRG